LSQNIKEEAMTGINEITRRLLSKKKSNKQTNKTDCRNLPNCQEKMSDSGTPDGLTSEKQTN